MMDDTELMEQDSEQIASGRGRLTDEESRAMMGEYLERMATVKLRSCPYSSERVRTAYEAAGKLGISPQDAAARDNEELQYLPVASGLDPSFQRFLSADSFRAAAFRDVLPAFNKVAVAYRRERKALPLAYIQPGKTAEDYAGDEEKKALAAVMDEVKRSVNVDLSSMAAFRNLDEYWQRYAAVNTVEHLKKRIVLSRELASRFGGDWNKVSDTELKADIKYLEKSTGMDFSDIDTDTLRQGGIGEADLWGIVNLFGVRDIAKALFFRRDPNRLGSVNEYSSTEDQLELLSWLNEQSLTVRGLTTTAKIAESVAEAIPFMAEFWLTGGVATVTRGGGKMAARLAIKEALKEAGFTGWRAGWKALVTKAGWKGIGEAARYAALAELKRTPFYLAKDVSEALNERADLKSPVYFMGDDGVQMVLPEEKAGELETLLARAVVRDYIGRFSEWGGEFMPEVDLGFLLPKGVRTAMSQNFMNWLAKDPVKRKLFATRFAENVPIGGFIQEHAEEWLNNFYEYVSTKIGRSAGIEALDMGREDVFGSLEENVVIAATCMFLSGINTGVRLTGAAFDYQQTARDVDNYRRKVEALSAATREMGSSAPVREFTEEAGRRVEESPSDDTGLEGGGALLFVATADARTLMQTNPAMAEALGFREDAVKGAEEKGQMLVFGEDALIRESAKSPENRAAGENLYMSTRALHTGRTVRETLNSEELKLRAERFKIHQENVRGYQQKIAAGVEAAVRQVPGLSRGAVANFCRLAAVMVNTLADGTLDDAGRETVNKALDSLTFRFIQHPEDFRDPYEAKVEAARELMGVQERTTPAPAVEETKPSETETKPSETAAEEIKNPLERGIRENLENPEALWNVLLPELTKYAALKAAQFSGTAADPDRIYDAAVDGAMSALDSLDPERKGSLSAYIRTAVERRVIDYLRKQGVETSQTVSLDAETEEGGTLLDTIQGRELSPSEARMVEEGNALLDEFAKGLTAKEQELLKLAREMVNETGGINQSELGRKLGITSEAVRQRLRRLGAKLGPHVLRQGLPGDAKGAITMAPNFGESLSACVTLFATSNASTLPHELAHWVKALLGELVDKGLAGDRLREDWALLNTWLDRQSYKTEEGTQARAEEREEKFARAFEAYIQTGRVPAGEVHSAFLGLRKLVSAVYQYARSYLSRAFGFELSDDIQRVFGHLLDGERAVEKVSPLQEAVDVLKASFSELLGLTQSESRAYRRLLDQVKAQTVHALEQKKQRLLPGLRRQWSLEAREIMSEMDVYKAWKEIVKEGGLDKDFLKSLPGIPAESLAYLKSMRLLSRKAGGLDPVVFAERYGYSSVEDLVSKLAGTLHPKAYESNYLRQAESEFHESLTVDGTELAEKGMLELLDNLSEKLATDGGIEGWRQRKAELLSSVKEELGKRSVRGIVEDRGDLDALKAESRELVKAIGKKDYAGAFEHAVKVRRNLAVLSGKGEAKARVEKIRRLMKRDLGAKKGRIFGDHHNALKELAYYFQFTERKPEVPPEGNASWRRMLSQSADDPDGVFPPDPVVRNEKLYTVERVPYGELPFSEFEELADYAEWLDGTGRELVSGDRESFTNRVKAYGNAAIEAMSGQKKRYHNRRSEWNAAGHIGRMFFNWGRNLYNLMSAADGYTKEDRGNRLLRKVLADGAARETELSTEVFDLLRPHTEVLGRLVRENRIRLPEGVVFTGNGALHGYSSWTPDMVVAFCLNMGNSVNRSRVLEGYGWTDWHASRVTDCMPEEGWHAIQGVWDALGGRLKRETAATFLEENHYRMKMQQPDEFTVKTAEGTELTLKGGYYPIGYVFRTRGKDIAMGYTPRALHAIVGSTMARSEELKHVDPVSLSTGLLVKHVRETSHYAATRMGCRLFLKVIMSDGYRDAFGQTQSYEAYDALLRLAKNIANPAQAEDGFWSSVMRWSRCSMTAAALMMNPRSMGMQLTSVSLGANELGSYWVNALGSLGSDFLGTLDFVRSKSAMMAHRAQFFDIDAAEQILRMNDGKLERTRQAFARVGYAGMQMLDGVVASAGWLARYQQMLDKWSGKPGLSLEEIDRKAVSEADDFVSRTQGSNRPLELTAAQLTELGRAMTPFITAANAQWNTLLTTLGSIRKGELSFREGVMALLSNLLAPAALAGAIAFISAGPFEGDGDDEDPMDRAMKLAIQEALSSPLSGVPVLRDVWEQVAGLAADRMIGGKKLYAGPVFEAGSLAHLEKMFTSLKQGTGGAFDGNTAKALYKYSEFLGDVTCMPVVRWYSRGKRMYTGFGGELPDWMKEFDDAVKKPNKERK